MTENPPAPSRRTPAGTRTSPAPSARPLVSRPAPGPARSAPATAPQTLSSCSSTTSASPTSALTAARSPPRTSIGWPRRGQLHRLPHHTALLPGPRGAAHRTQPAGRASPTSPTRSRLPGDAFRFADNAPTLAETCATTGTRRSRWASGTWPATARSTTQRKGLMAAQRGFDRYFGSLEGFTRCTRRNRLVWDNSPLEVEEFPEGYYLTDDLTDRAIEMINPARRRRAQAVPPLPGPRGGARTRAGRGPRDYTGVYDAGWDTSARSDVPCARSRWACSVGGHAAAGQPRARSGRAPVGTQPQISSDGSPATWRSTPQRSRRWTPARVGWSSTWSVLGELDNTIIVFTSDNGATAEGGAEGTRSYYSQFAHLPGLPDDWELDVARDLALIGGPQTTVHYPRGWGRRPTPRSGSIRRTPSPAGSASRLCHWPAGLGPDGVRRAVLYVTDCATLLDLAGIDTPPPGTAGRHRPSTGSVSGPGPGPPRRGARDEQYSETAGQAGY